MELPADWDPKQRKRHPVSEKQSKEFLKKFDAYHLTSEAILESFRAQGTDSDWFAMKLRRIADGGDDRLALRAMELLGKILAHSEGSKILQTSDLTTRATQDLEEAYDELLGELKQEGVFDEPPAASG